MLTKLGLGMLQTQLLIVFQRLLRGYLGLGPLELRLRVTTIPGAISGRRGRFTTLARSTIARSLGLLRLFTLLTRGSLGRRLLSFARCLGQLFPLLCNRLPVIVKVVLDLDGRARPHGLGDGIPIVTVLIQRIEE